MTEIVPRPALSDVDPNQEVAPPVVPSGNSQLLETPPSSQELPLPMLDVHPIHAPVRGWRDFFIHIATIVVGLCIAVAIQQTVEFFHNRNELTETREALRHEREGNYKTLAENTTAWRWGTAQLQNNLLVLQYLQQHPGTPQEKLPGVLLWQTNNYPFGSAVWDAARQSGVIALMPREEIEANSGLYFYFQKVNDVQYEGARAIIEARRYDLSDADPSHLSPTQVAAEIELTEAALTAQSLRGTLLLNLVQAFPDFPATVTSEELSQIHHPPDRPTTELLRAARALTMERMKAAGYVYSNSPPAQK
jgi:hypothetical protein